MGTNSISVGIEDSVPPGIWRKIPSKSNSPVVIVMVLTRARAGVANEERCIGTRIKCSVSTTNVWIIGASI